MIRLKTQPPSLCRGYIDIYSGSLVAIVVLICLASCRIILATWFLVTHSNFPCIQNKLFISWTAFADIVLSEAIVTMVVAIYGLTGLFRTGPGPLKFTLSWSFIQMAVSILFIGYSVLIYTNYETISAGYLECSSIPSSIIFIGPVATKLVHMARSLMGYGICSLCFNGWAAVVLNKITQQMMRDAMRTEMFLPILPSEKYENVHVNTDQV